MEAVEYCYTETDHPQLDNIAKELGEYVVGAYPGYNWSITIRGGVVQIRSQKVHPKWGMQIMLNDLQFDGGVRKKMVVMKAGEFLECANMRRGSWKGDYAQTLEGRKDNQDFSPIITPTITPLAMG
jgi:hypothetical protein